MFSSLSIPKTDDGWDPGCFVELIFSSRLRDTRSRDKVCVCVYVHTYKVFISQNDAVKSSDSQHHYCRGGVGITVPPQEFYNSEGKSSKFFLWCRGPRDSPNPCVTLTQLNRFPRHLQPKILYEQSCIHSVYCVYMLHLIRYTCRAEQLTALHCVAIIYLYSLYICKVNALFVEVFKDAGGTNSLTHHGSGFYITPEVVQVRMHAHTCSDDDIT